MTYVYILFGINIVFSILIAIMMSGIKTETDVYNGVVKDKMQLLINKLYQLENDNRHIYTILRDVEDTTDGMDSKIDNISVGTYYPTTITYSTTANSCVNEVKDA